MRPVGEKVIDLFTGEKKRGDGLQGQGYYLKGKVDHWPGGEKTNDRKGGGKRESSCL